MSDLYLSPEIRDKCTEKRKKFLRERTDEALKELREVNAERHRLYYKEFSEGEKQRSARWSKIKVTCDVCNIKLNKPSMKDHLNTDKHKKNIELQDKPIELGQHQVRCECGLILLKKGLARHIESKSHQEKMKEK